MSDSSKIVLQEVLPKAGLVYSEKGNLSEVLCKPKIMPIKSITLEKLEAMEVRLPSFPLNRLPSSSHCIRSATGSEFIGVCL